MKARLFSSQEKKDIRELLSKTVNPEEAFNLEELHGFLFGLAITSDLIKPNEWLPVVFGEELLEFETKEEAEEMMGNLFRVYNRFNGEHRKGKLFFPFDIGDLETGDLTRISDWAYGLSISMTLRPDTWTIVGEAGEEESLTEDEEELVSSCGIIMGVAEPDRIPEIFEKEGFDPEVNEKDLQLQATLFGLLPSAVATLQAHTRQKFGEHKSDRTPKLGRNDSCPCGSEKKFKKCCGLN
jgi:uncharacterized protein